MKPLNDYIAVYKGILEQGDVQIAYENLCKYVMSLKTHFSRKYAGRYTFGSISPGYMDFTYFPFFDDFLRGRKLRFGVVLNHREARFELWLMGQNSEVQIYYWKQLQYAKWNKGRLVMPAHSVLEVILAEDPDFNHLDRLTEAMIDCVLPLAEEIEDSVTKIKSPF